MSKVSSDTTCAKSHELSRSPTQLPDVADATPAGGLSTLRTTMFARAPLYGQSELIAASQATRSDLRTGRYERFLTRTPGDSNGNQVGSMRYRQQHLVTGSAPEGICR